MNMNSNIEPAIDIIAQAFLPKPIKTWINGKLHLIERIGSEWTWRTEDGDCQEDFGIEPFASAVEAQQSAIHFVRATKKAAS